MIGAPADATNSMRLTRGDDITRAHNIQLWPQPGPPAGRRRDSAQCQCELHRQMFHGEVLTEMHPKSSSRDLSRFIQKPL